MYCTTNTLKYILCVLNLLCALLGSVLIWFGFWLLETTEDATIDHGEYLAAIASIVLGSVVLLAAVYGSVAVQQESKGMLIAYAIILVFLLVIQLIIVSISYAATTVSLPDGLKQGFDELWDPNDQQTNSTLSLYEEWLQCCGKNSADDYLLLDKIPPQSCCKELDCTNVHNLNVIGCEQRFKEYVHAKTSNFNLISWLLIVVEFIGSVFACILVDSIRNHLDRRRFYG